MIHELETNYASAVQGDTPRKINMEHKNEGLENDFPLQMSNGWLSGSMSIFLGLSWMTNFKKWAKKNSHFPLYWLPNGDPYIMVYENPHITG